MTGTLTGTHHNPDDTAHTGVAIVSASVPQIRDQAGHIVYSGTVTRDLDDQGTWSAELPPTDDPTLEPHGFTWSVVVRFTDGAASLVWTGVELPAGETVHVDQAGSADPSAPTYTELVNAAKVHADLAESAATRAETAAALSGLGTGIAGPQGDPGPEGAPGPEGPQGPQGVQGLVGPRGPEGQQGAVGPRGLQGDQGPQGVRGPQGVQGVKGDAGPAGPAGLTFRNAWSASVDYAAGDSVAYQGSSWFASVDPPVGEVPSQASAYWWPMALQGAKGDPGSQGVQGLQGPAGPKGDKGDPGAPGAQGPQGDTGAAGAQGIQGPQGVKGDTGAQGLQGIQGVKGDQGPTGPKGADSTVPGPQGPQGIPGLTGPAGPAGADGAGGGGVVVLDKATPPLTAAVVNTTTETILAQLAIPAARVAAGDLLSLEYALDSLNQSGTGATVTYRFKIGGTTVFTYAASLSSGGAARYRSHGRMTVMVASLTDLRCGITLGGTAPGVAVANNRGYIGGGAGATTAGGSAQVTTEDMSTDKTLTVTVQLSAANAGLDTRLLGASLVRTR